VLSIQVQFLIVGFEFVAEFAVEFVELLVVVVVAVVVVEFDFVDSSLEEFASFGFEFEFR